MRQDKTHLSEVLKNALHLFIKLITISLTRHHILNSLRGALVEGGVTAGAAGSGCGTSVPWGWFRGFPGYSEGIVCSAFTVSTWVLRFIFLIYRRNLRFLKRAERRNFKIRADIISSWRIESEHEYFTPSPLPLTKPTSSMMVHDNSFSSVY